MTTSTDVAVVAPPPALRWSALTKGWRWRQAHGPDLSLGEMHTSHLFFTLRMIWNNHMPVNMRVGHVKLYRFGPRHPPAYLREAILMVGSELFTRTDIKPWQRRQLDEMAAWFTDVDARAFIDDARTTSLMRRSVAS